MLPLIESDLQPAADKEKLRRNLLFQNELQSILVFLVKEKSIGDLSQKKFYSVV